MRQSFIKIDTLLKPVIDTQIDYAFQPHVKAIVVFPSAFKLAHAVTPIKQSPVFRCHLFLSYHRKFLMNLTSFIILYANFLHYPFISLDKRYLLIFANLS